MQYYVCIFECMYALRGLYSGEGGYGFNSLSKIFDCHPNPNESIPVIKVKKCISMKYPGNPKSPIFLISSMCMSMYMYVCMHLSLQAVASLPLEPMKHSPILGEKFCEKF